MDTLKRSPGRIKNLTENEIQTAVGAVDIDALNDNELDEFVQLYLISSRANAAIHRLVNVQGVIAIVGRLRFKGRGRIMTCLTQATTAFLRKNEEIYANEFAESNGDGHEDESANTPATAVNGHNGAVHVISENPDVVRLTQEVCAMIDEYAAVGVFKDAPLTSAVLVGVCLTIFTRESCNDEDIRMRVVDAVHLHYSCHFDIHLLDKVLGQEPVKKAEIAVSVVADTTESLGWDNRAFLAAAANLPLMEMLDEADNRTVRQMLKVIGEQSPRPFDFQHVQIICINLNLVEGTPAHRSVSHILCQHFGVKKTGETFELPSVPEAESTPPPAPRKIDQWEGQFLGPRVVQSAPQVVDQLMAVPRGDERRHAIPKIFDPAEAAEHIKKMAPLGSGADRFFAALYRYFGTTHFQKTTVLRDETEEDDNEDESSLTQTQARPGSEEKLQILGMRYLQGTALKGGLFSELDAQDHTPDASIAFTKLANLARLAAEDADAAEKGEPVKKRKGRRTAGKVA